ncbi:hypothetical protein IKE83_02060 [Candidatus Saccharibacteria bacterium]|nr:hypothetical protein [Candidatus Saccharibacteria bacterium]
MRRLKQTIIAILGIITSGFATANVLAISEQNDVEVQFTWNPSLSVALSSDSISIDELNPGQFLSNYATAPLTITVSTNSVLGYTLNANVGTQAVANNRLNLTNDVYFTSLATDASLTAAQFTTDGTWGYTIDGTNYSGLPAYGTEKTLNRTTNSNAAGATGSTGYAGGTTTTFGIAAKAASGQQSGDYTNVINFTAVSNVTTD